MDILKTAVIGIGNMGFAHASCIANGEIDGMRLTAVCDTDIRKTKIFKEKHPQIKTFSDYKDLINSNIADCVIIATPHPSHAEIAIYALENDVHVMLEKPADISVSKVKVLNEVAEKSGKVFSIMFNQRTNSLFKKAREIVKSGALGELKRTVWIITNWYRTQKYYDSGDWRATWSGEGGGVLINQCPHNLDLWQWICGMPHSVTAVCDIAKYHNIEVEDDVTLFIRYENGAVGTFIASTGEYPGTNRLEISGSKGKIVIENGILKWWKLGTDEREVCKNSDESFVKIDYDYTEIKQEEKESGHKGILRNFTNAVLFGEELLSPGTDGIFELTVSNAAYLSSWNGGTEVKLPFDTEEFDLKLSKLAESSGKRNNTDSFSSDSKYKSRWEVNW